MHSKGGIFLINPHLLTYIHAINLIVDALQEWTLLDLFQLLFLEDAAESCTSEMFNFQAYITRDRAALTLSGR
jgi:hypothetical protein